MKRCHPIAGLVALLVCLVAGCQGEICSRHIQEATAAAGLSRSFALPQDAGLELAIHTAMDRGFEVVHMDVEGRCARLSSIVSRESGFTARPRIYLAIFVTASGPETCEMSIVCQGPDGKRAKTDWATRILDDIQKAVQRYKVARA
jgi:hypothetical protein